jgi:hypothetical protein
VIALSTPFDGKARAAFSNALNPPPDIFKLARRRRGVARRRVDWAVAEIGLQGSRIDALIGQRVAAGMPKHDRFVAGAGEQLGEARRGARTAPFGDEGRRSIVSALQDFTPPSNCPA